MPLANAIPSRSQSRNLLLDTVGRCTLCLEPTKIIERDLIIDVLNSQSPPGINLGQESIEVGPHGQELAQSLRRLLLICGEREVLPLDIQESLESQDGLLRSFGRSPAHNISRGLLCFVAVRFPGGAGRPTTSVFPTDVPTATPASRRSQLRWYKKAVNVHMERYRISSRSAQATPCPFRESCIDPQGSDPLRSDG